jgi:hypothetical protein
MPFEWAKDPGDKELLQDKINGVLDAAKIDKLQDAHKKLYVHKFNADGSLDKSKAATTLLHKAIEWGDCDMTMQIMESNLAIVQGLVSVDDSYGKTPVHKAIAAGNNQTYRELVDLFSKKDVPQPVYTYGRFFYNSRPKPASEHLMDAVGDDRLVKAAAAFAIGANPDSSRPGETLCQLAVASAKNNFPMVELLIEKGANPLRLNVNGKTPLELFEMRSGKKNTQIAEALKAAMAKNPDAKMIDHEGKETGETVWGWAKEKNILDQIFLPAQITEQQRLEAEQASPHSELQKTLFHLKALIHVTINKLRGQQ